MTDLSNLEQLRARVMEAKGEDREIDGDIDAAFRVGTPIVPEWVWQNFPTWKHIGSGRVCCLHDDGSDGPNWASANFTASVDAALAFVNRVLPGWQINMHHYGEGSTIAEASIGNRAKATPVNAATLPLALLAAALSALIEKEKAGG